jgi:hypothetical protein
MIRRCVIWNSCFCYCWYSYLNPIRFLTAIDAGYSMLDPGYEPPPATAATMTGVPAKRISRFGPVSLPGVWCNCNHSKPSARSRFRGDNCDENARLLPTRDQNIFPNKDALPPMPDHKNKFRPNELRLWRSRAPSACRTSIRRPRLTRDLGCDPRSPRRERPRVPILPAPLPDNASQNLHAARPSVIPNGVVWRPVALCEDGRDLFLHLRE